jgi:ABC-type nickel/cobalt efflux system permease component RcnA
VVAIALAPFVQSLTENQMQYQLNVIGLKMRNGLMAAIYRKCLRLSNAALQSESTGRVVTLMSNDAQKVGVCVCVEGRVAGHAAVAWGSCCRKVCAARQWLVPCAQLATHACDHMCCAQPRHTHTHTHVHTHTYTCTHTHTRPTHRETHRTTHPRRCRT